jgi:molecular chaperone DnaJ
MNITEAYSILGMPENATGDELKSQYKKLAVKFHPDVYKEDINKLKEINEAYQYINDYKANPQKYNTMPFGQSPFGSGGTINLNDLFKNGFGGQQQRQFNYPPINVNINISFKDSILGIDKEIQFKRHIKCVKCDGQGNEHLGNGCQACGGKGRIMSQQGNTMFSGTCTKCFGKNMETKKCEPCNSVGVQEVDTQLSIHIPAGINNNSSMRLKGVGNYVGASIFGDACTDVFVSVNVDTLEGLILEGTNVVSHLNLSLLEALTGAQKEIKTIFDTRQVQIPAGSKNKEEIILEGLGVVSAQGKQRVILDIEYPNDTNDLVEYLKSKGN